MKGPGLRVDERNLAITRKICTGLYLLTIAALWLDVCWRQFVLNQPLSQFLDLAALMTINVLLVLGAILYYGGVTVPKMSASAVAVLYLVCVAVGTAFTVYKYHLSSADEILWRLVLVAAITGLVVVLYVIAAYIGNRKTEREIGE
ncbi:MAG: hypothetical protein LAP85_22920 [Acidobacteriia bacterium]|nr:hypothetical protein [Terriglobia bacterium]